MNKILKIFGEPEYGGATFINGVLASEEDCRKLLRDIVFGAVKISKWFVDGENDLEIETV